MGVDHGLSGRFNERKRVQRKNRLKKMFAISQESAAASAVSGTDLKLGKAVTTAKKGEVVFNEEARVEWLTGFGKRKQERRKHGLAMNILKKKNILKDTRKMKRKTLEGNTNIAPEGGGEGEEGAQDSMNNEQSCVYSDHHTVNMFGADVSVVINTDLSANDDAPTAAVGSDRDDSSDLSDMDNRSVGSYKKQQVKQLSKFEKALQEVGKKGLLNKRRESNGQKFKLNGKKGGKKDAKALLYAAVPSAYKQKKKRR